MDKRLIALMAMLGTLALVNCSHTTQIMSEPASSDFLIDGDRGEWTGRFSVPKDAKCAVGIGHNKNYVYLALTSIDPAFQRQLNMNGMTLWLDPKGKKHEILGIKYAGMRGARKSIGELDMGHRGVGRDLQPEDFTAGGSRRGERRLKPLSGDLEMIVVDADKRERLGPSDLLATVRTTEAGLFLEIQIPLALLGSEYQPGSRLGIGLESSNARAERMPRDDMSGGMDGDSGGMGSGQRPGGGRSGAGMGGQRPGGLSGSDLELWFQVDFPKQ